MAQAALSHIIDGVEASIMCAPWMLGLLYDGCANRRRPFPSGRTMRGPESS